MGTNHKSRQSKHSQGKIRAVERRPPQSMKATLIEGGELGISENGRGPVATGRGAEISSTSVGRCAGGNSPRCKTLDALPEIFALSSRLSLKRGISSFEVKG